MIKKTINILFGSTEHIYDFLKQENIKNELIISEKKVNLDDPHPFIDTLYTHELYEKEKNVYYIIDDFDIEKVSNTISSFGELSKEYNFALKGILLMTQEEMDMMEEEELDRLSLIFGTQPEILSSSEAGRVLDDEQIQITDLKIYRLGELIDKMYAVYGKDSETHSLNETLPDSLSEILLTTFEKILQEINLEK